MNRKRENEAGHRKQRPGIDEMAQDIKHAVKMRPVIDKRGRTSMNEACHRKQRADIDKVERNPLYRTLLMRADIDKKREDIDK